MRTFAQNSKSTAQPASAKIETLDRAHFGRIREANPALCLQSTIGDQGVRQLLEANMENGKGDSPATGIARSGRDLSRIPAHLPIRSPTRQKAEWESDMRERVRASGFI